MLLKASLEMLELCCKITASCSKLNLSTCHMESLFSDLSFWPLL